MSKKYDVAAFFWPSYTGDEPRARIFWPEGYGEWQTVKAMQPQFEGHEWPRKPLWGYINEADPFVMEMEIEAAAHHGVNVFIFDWYWYDDRPFLEQSLNNGYLKARNNDKVKFYVMWANHTAGSTWDKRTAHENNLVWEFAQGANRFKTISDRIVKQYFGHDSYYKIGNKPVFQIYDFCNFLMGLEGVDGAKRALYEMNNAAVKAGFDGVHTQVTLRSQGDMMWTSPRFGFDGTVKDGIDYVGIDSITHYQLCAEVKKLTEYVDMIPLMTERWETCKNEYKAPYFPHVSLGWDPTPRFIPKRQDIVQHAKPEYVEQVLRKAREYIDANPALPTPLVTINSWNEWTETSYLQPDDLYGYGYLEAVKKVFIDEVK